MIILHHENQYRQQAPLKLEQHYTHSRVNVKLLRKKNRYGKQILRSVSACVDLKGNRGKCGTENVESVHMFISICKIQTFKRLTRTLIRHCSTLSSVKAKLKTFLFSQYFHPN